MHFPWRTVNYTLAAMPTIDNNVKHPGTKTPKFTLENLTSGFLIGSGTADMQASWFLVANPVRNFSLALNKRYDCIFVCCYETNRLKTTSYNRPPCNRPRTSVPGTNT